jgi:4-amino-4-deoxy-L-arabinose transferase-like glycosyltransferase
LARQVTRAAIWLIALSTAVRLAIAAWLPLGTDETYAIAVAREFSWSFFDHPPLGFWLPVAMAKLTGVEAAIVYRLPFVAFGTLSSVMIWRLGDLLGGARAGFYALILFVAAPYMMIGGGLFVVPDGPLDAFLLLAAYALAVALMQPHAPLRQWLLVGLWLALAMACKYQAALFPVATLAFLLFTRGQWRRLGQPGPWLAAGIGILGLTPVVVWNLQHDWASFSFHTGRVGASFQPVNFARMLLGQLLYLLPATFCFACAALWSAGKRDTDMAARLLAWLAIFPIAMFMFTYIYGKNTFPHWTMPGWLFAMPLAGHWLAQREPALWAKRAFWACAAPFWAVLAILVIHVPTGILTRTANAIPVWDNTTEIFDYGDLAAILKTRGWLTDTTLIVALDWIDGGHVSTALKGRYAVRILGPERHHFQYMAAASQTVDGVLLIPGRGASLQKKLDSVTDIAAANGATLVPLGQITLPRAGRPYLDIAAYRVTW